MRSPTQTEIITSILSCLLVACLTMPLSAEPYQDLAALLPDSANAVLAIDAKNFFDSPLGIQRKWRESHAANFDRSPMLLPPLADRFVLATELDIEHFEPMWELAAMTMERPVSQEEIEQRLGATADTLAGMQVVRTKTGAFVVPYRDGRVALIRRGQRQWAARQIRLGEKRSSPIISTFLQQALQPVASGEAQIAIAVSLEDAVSLEEIRAAVERSTLARDANFNPEAITKLMSSLKGFIFTVTVTDAMKGTLSMVFGTEPDALGVIAKPFMLDIVGGAGAVLPEFADWNEERDRRSISLSGDLSLIGLRRILTLLQVDTSELEEMQTAKSTSQKVDRRKTERYVKRVTEMVDDISSGAKANNLQQQLLWTDRTAKSIGRISTRNVSPKVVSLGNQIARDLRDIVVKFNYASDKARARSRALNAPPIEPRTELVPFDQVSTPAGRFYRYAPFQYAQVNVAGNVARQQQIMAEEMARANKEAKTLLASAERKIEEMNRLVFGPQQ